MPWKDSEISIYKEVVVRIHNKSSDVEFTQFLFFSYRQKAHMHINIYPSYFDKRNVRMKCSSKIMTHQSSS